MPLYLYLICHNRTEIKTHTYIGCTENFLKRLNQHNGLEPGGPRITKRAAGAWNPVLILKLPTERKFNAKDLKKEWKSSSRGLSSRIRKGLELAVKYKLKIIMPNENKYPKLEVLNYIHSRWKDDKVDMTDDDWNHILTSEL